MIFEVKDISYTYPGMAKKTLDHCSLTLKAGETLSILGPNGAGKSTLMNCMCGLLIPQEGEVHLCGRNVKKLSVKQIAKQVGYVQQNHTPVFGKTAKSILISCASRLAPFDIKEVREITMYDELDLDMLGDERTALFLIMSDTDGTFAFLISLIYSILFNRLCERADDVYGGRLPIHVRCLIDEAANIGQIPNLERLMATIRSREISACLVLQAQSQLKALYKDNMDTVIGNCDASLFLGGKEETTLKSWNSLLGKETIDLYNTSVTKGNQESHGQNFQKLGKDLMSVDELAVMDGGKCLLQIRGVRPFLSRKYDITKHPNYKLLSDFNEKNAFNIEKFLSTRMPMRPGERYRNYEVTAEDLASQTL